MAYSIFARIVMTSCTIGSSAPFRHFLRVACKHRNNHRAENVYIRLASMTSSNFELAGIEYAGDVKWGGAVEILKGI